MLATLDQRADAFRRSIRANVHYWRASLLTPPAVADATDHAWGSVIRAILYACEEPSTRVDAAHLAIGLFEVMQRRGAWHEWHAVLQRVVDALTEEPALRSRVLTQIGQCRLLSGHYEAAREALEEAEQLALQSGDRVQLARSRASLSESYRRLRRYPEAVRQGQWVLEDLAQLTLTAETRFIKAATLTTMGTALGEAGQPEEGLAHLQQALVLTDADQQPIEASRILNNMAFTLIIAGRLADALPYLDRVLGCLADLPRAVSDRTRVWLNKGTIHFGLGRLPEAEASFLAIEVDALRRQGHVAEVAHTTNNLGNTYQQMGRLPEAEAKLTEALALMRDLADDIELANVLLTLGEVLEAQGRRAEAEPKWREAVQRAEQYPTDIRAQRYVAKGRKYLTG